MTTFELKKMAETPDSTLSGLWLKNAFVCFIIEDGYRENKVSGVTRIPAGTYKIGRKVDGRFFEKYKPEGFSFVPELLDVPNFSGILIHRGNTVIDTRGCLLPNKGAWHGDRANCFYGSDSRGAFLHLWKLINTLGDCEIKITR